MLLLFAIIYLILNISDSVKKNAERNEVIRTIPSNETCNNFRVERMEKSNEVVILIVCTRKSKSNTAATVL